LGPRARALFRNLSFCESAIATIALPEQGFASMVFNRGKIGLKDIQIA
jgi:hypothetical protein